MKAWALLLLLTGCTAQPAFASKDIAHRIERLSGEVCGATAVGGRTLLSAAHCVDKDDQVLIVNGAMVGILRMEFDGADHVLIVVTKTFKRHTRVVSAPVQGDRVHWWGQPMGLRDVYGEGVIVGEYEGRTLIDGSIWYGVSGSGLLNARGEVVGVVSAIMGQQIYKLGVALPIVFTAKQWATVS